MRIESKIRNLLGKHTTKMSPLVCCPVQVIEKTFSFIVMHFLVQRSLAWTVKYHHVWMSLATSPKTRACGQHTYKLNCISLLIPGTARTLSTFGQAGGRLVVLYSLLNGTPLATVAVHLPKEFGIMDLILGYA